MSLNDPYIQTYFSQLQQVIADLPVTLINQVIRLLIDCAHNNQLRRHRLAPLRRGANPPRKPGRRWKRSPLQLRESPPQHRHRAV